MKITVIIPTYNRCAYLRQAVDSVLSQSYPQLEVIVADNASTDATASEMAKYYDSGRIKYFRNERNIGMYPNWQKALNSYATGEWTLILSDDDFLRDPDYLQKAANIIGSVQGLVAVFSNYSQHNEVTGEVREFRKDLPKVSLGTDIFLNWEKSQALPSTVIFDTALARRLDFFSAGILSCDWADFLRLVLHGKVGFIPDCVVGYRVHPDNASRKPIDLAEGYSNLKYISIAKAHALETRALPEKTVDAWERRLFDMHNRIICGQIARTDPAKLRELAAYLGYPRMLGYFLFSPRNIAKLGLGLLSKAWGKAAGGN